MAAPGPAHWTRAEAAEGPRFETEAAHEPHEAIRDNFSRILEGGTSQNASASFPVATGFPLLARTASRLLEAPRVWLESPPRPTRIPAANSPESLPAYGAARGLKAEPFGAVKFRGAGSIPPLESELEEMFPRMFTCLCLLIFITPIFMMVRIGRDSSVKFWFGSWCDLALLLPLLFIFGHFVHRSKGRPHKATVIVCLLVPPFVLLILGECVLTSLSDKANQLFSTDCDTFPEKRALEAEHIAAESVFANCLADTLVAVAGHNLTLQHAAELYRIQDCEEYEMELQSHQASWTYLRHMEEQHMCAGWCGVSRPIWTYGTVKDSCSVAVSTIFDGKVKHMASQIVVYSILVIFLAAIFLLVVGAPLRQAGIQW